MRAPAAIGRLYLENHISKMWPQLKELFLAVRTRFGDVISWRDLFPIDGQLQDLGWTILDLRQCGLDAFAFPHFQKFKQRQTKQKGGLRKDLKI